MREYCQNCHKTLDACYCHKIVKVKNSSKVIILQHPTESKHALNTARIANLSFQNCEIIIGEDFSEHQKLNEILQSENCFLLFPTDQARSVKTIFSTIKDQKITLILLDGSWKKAKKIYYLSKNLHSLPKVQLTSEHKSRYRLRKQPLGDYLSTLEALTYALNTIEDCDFNRVFEAFDFMIEFQIKKMGELTFQYNYNPED